MQTAAYAGWAGLKNDRLLHAAEEAAFDVFLTGDRKMPSQQNMSGRRIAIVVLSTVDFDIMQPYLDRIREAINHAVPGSLQHVECGRFSR